MTFSVNLTALRGLPRFLDRRQRDLASAASYVRDHTILRYGSGLANVAHHHETNVKLVSFYLSAAGEHYPRADAARLRQAISGYASADARAAARYDESLPHLDTDISDRPLSTSLGPQVFDDRGSPSTTLVAPAGHGSDMPYQPSWFDLLSPTSILRDLIWKLSGIAAHVGILDRPYDPFEFFVAPYVGDWAGILRSAEVFEHVSTFLGVEADQVGIAGSALPEVWHGNAAALCAANFAGFESHLIDGVEPLRDLASAYRGVARGVHDNAILLSAALTTLFDCVAESAIEIDTGGLLTMYEIGTALIDFVRTLRTALHIAGAVQDIVSAGFTISDEAAHRLGVLNVVVSMPASAAATPAIPTGP